MSGEGDEPVHQDSNRVSSIALDIIRCYRTCEFTTLFRDGSPQTWPVSAHLLGDGRFLLCTSIGLPQKAFNIRRNANVSLLFSEPTASGVAQAGAVLVQGQAVAEDTVVTDVQATPEFAAFNETVMARQPASKAMSSWLGRRLFYAYYLRILIHVEPERVRLWPDRDFALPPIELHPRELRNVA